MATDCNYDMNRINHIGDDLATAFNEGYAQGKEDSTPKWIPITERVPDKDTRALVFTKNGAVYAATFTGFGWVVPFYTKEITHWMPLPQPPTEVE